MPDEIAEPTEPTEPTAKKVKAKQIVSDWPMYALGLVILVDQLDQNILRGVLSQVQEHFQLSDFAAGMLVSSFIIAHGIMTVPAGYIADRRNRVKTVGWTVIFWSLISALTGVSMTFWQIFMIRAVLGFGQAMTEPAANSLLADYYPMYRRGKAYSIQQVSFIIGMGAGLGLGGFIGEAFGSWRWAFFLSAIPGLATAVLIYRLSEPKRGMGDRISAGVTKEFEPAEEHEHQKLFQWGLKRFLKDMIIGLRDDMKTIMAIPTLRYMLVGVGTLLFTVMGVSAWLPIFYQREYGISEKAATALVGGMIAVGGTVGTLYGGRLADRLASKIKGARAVISGLSLTAATIIFAISYLPMPMWARFSIEVVGIIPLTMSIPALRAGMADAVPASLRGAGFAAFTLISAVLGSLAPPLIGWLSDVFDNNLRIAFYVVTPPVLLGAAILYRARHHMDDDAGKIIGAVMTAMQQQQQEEAEREAEVAEASASAGTDGDSADPDNT